MNYEFKESDIFSADSFAEMGLVDRLVTHMKGATLGAFWRWLNHVQLTTTFLVCRGVIIPERTEKMNLDKPTHIQRAAVPHLLAGKDVYVDPP